MLSYIAANATGRSLIIVPSSELREDMITKLNNIDSKLDVGSVQASLDEVDSKVIIATRQSLTHSRSTRIERMLEHGEFQYVIFDEAHQAPDQIKKILKKIDTSNSIIFGLTATPWNKAMYEIFDKINYSKDILWMIDNEYLIEPKVIQVNTRTSLDEVKTVAGEFNQKQLEDTVNTDYRNDLIVKAWKEYAEDREHSLIFCSGIQHSNDLSEEFKRNGIACESIDSSLDNKDRERILNQFKSGKLKVLCNVGVLTTGFDMAAIDCIVYARPTKSKILFAQILGRGLRLNAGKENCLVLDFKDVASKHDLLSMDDFFVVNFKNGETYKKAKERCENEMIKLIEEQQKREEARQKNLELYAVQVKLFNREMNKAFLEVYYDWYKINNNLWVVSQDADICLGVVSYNNEFMVLKIVTEKEKQGVKEINTYENIIEAIEWVEKNINNPRSFAYKDASWKKEPISEKQRQYCPWAKNKWEVSKFFNKSKINRLVEKFLLNNT